MEKEPVAAVCGNECRIYGPVNESGKRPLQRIKTFSNYGQARMYAQDFDDATKNKVS